MCGRKRRFRTLRLASIRAGKKCMFAYECPYCGGAHVTKRNPVR